jgi:hypothetical protein
LYRVPGIVAPFSQRIPDSGPLRAAVQSAAVGDQVRFVLTIARSLPREMCDDMLMWFAKGMPTAKARVEFLVAARQLGLPPAVTEEWARLARGALVTSARKRLEAGAVPWPKPALEDLLTWCGDQPAQAWLKVFKVAAQAPRVNTLRAAVAQAMTLPPQERDTALTCLVIFFVARGPSARQFADAIPVLRDRPQEAIAMLAEGCLLALREGAGDGPALELFSCLLSRAGRSEPIAGPEQMGIISALARQLRRGTRDEITSRAEAAGPQAVAWWKQVTGGRASALGAAVHALGRMVGLTEG